MQAIKLDFCRTRRTPRWVSAALLAISLAFCGDVGFSIIKLQQGISVSEKTLARSDPKRYRPARNASAEEIAAARETVQRLSTPWDRLFAALEAAATDEVALLAIEPDAKAGTVTISGDSKNYLAALSYVLNLSRAESLSKVHLARHETRKDPQRSVAFSVSATWSPSAQPQSSVGASRP